MYARLESCIQQSALHSTSFTECIECKDVFIFSQNQLSSKIYPDIPLKLISIN